MTEASIATNSQAAERQFGEVLLEVDNISLSFGAVHALVDVSFGIREREILAIIGPNGAGKTTMLNVLNGVYTPDKGAIIFKARHGSACGRMNRPGWESRGRFRTSPCSKA